MSQSGQGDMLEESPFHGRPFPEMKEQNKAPTQALIDDDSSQVNLQDYSGPQIGSCVINVEGTQIKNPPMQGTKGKKIKKGSRIPRGRLEQNKISVYDKYQGVFRQYNQSYCQRKNTNFVKFLTKHYFRQIQRLSDQEKNQNMQWINFNKKLNKQVFRKSRNNITLKQMIFIFNSQRSSSFVNEMEKKNRIFASRFLRNTEFMKQNIIQNNYMETENQRQYLLVSKVFRLRCRSKLLVHRQETR